MILAPTSRRLVEALAAAGAGETVSLNAGTYAAPKGGFVVAKGVRLAGTHPLRNRLQGGTVLAPATPDDPILRIESENVRIADLVLRGPGRPGGGDGIFLARSGTPSCIELERLMVWGVGRDGLHFDATDGSINLLEIKSCSLSQNGRHGLYVSNSFGVAVTGGYYSGNGHCGAMFDLCTAAMLWHVAFERNQSAGAHGDYEPQLYLRGGSAHNVDGCTFEDFNAGGGGCAITIENSTGARVVGGMFLNATTATSRGIVFRNRCEACLVDHNTWRRVTSPFDIDPSCREVTTRPQAVESKRD